VGVVRRALKGTAGRRAQRSAAVVTGPEIGVCTSVAVVLGGCCGITVEAVVPESLNVPAAGHDICIDLSSFGKGLVRVARKVEAVEVRLPTSFDFTGLLHELSEFLPLRPMCSPRPLDLIGRVIAQVAVDYSGTSVTRLANELSVSTDHLSRAFRDDAAMTMKQYIIRVRLEVAKCLLRAAGDKV